jgi:hypothetical protein
MDGTTPPVWVRSRPVGGSSPDDIPIDTSVSDDDRALKKIMRNDFDENNKLTGITGGQRSESYHPHRTRHACCNANSASEALIDEARK